MELARALLRSRLAWTGLFVALLVGSLPRLQRFMMRDPRFHAIPGSVRAEAPEWGGPELVEPSARALERLGPLSLFDPRFEARIEACLRKRPEVASVDAIRRHWPDRYSVSVSYRRPYAVVDSGAGEIPVTADGIALEPGPFARAAAGLLRIRGVASRPPPFGAVWKDEALREGLRTIEQIGAHWDELAPLGIGAVDVSAARDRLLGVRLLGEEGTRIRWGRPSASVGENSVEKKIELLRVALRSLEQARGRELDVRYGALYVVRESTAP